MNDGARVNDGDGANAAKPSALCRRRGGREAGSARPAAGLRPGRPDGARGRPGGHQLLDDRSRRGARHRDRRRRRPVRAPPSRRSPPPRRPSRRAARSRARSRRSRARRRGAGLRARTGRRAGAPHQGLPGRDGARQGDLLLRVRDAHRFPRPGARPGGSLSQPHRAPAGGRARRGQDGRRHRLVRARALLLDVLAAVRARVDQDGQAPEPGHEPRPRLGPVRPAQVLPGVRGRHLRRGGRGAAQAGQARRNAGRHRPRRRSGRAARARARLLRRAAAQDVHRRRAATRAAAAGPHPPTHPRAADHVPLLHHDPHLLRQRPAPPGHLLHDRRRRRAGPLPAGAARQGQRLLPDRASTSTGRRSSASRASGAPTRSPTATGSRRASKRPGSRSGSPTTTSSARPSRATRRRSPRCGRACKRTSSRPSTTACTASAARRPRARTTSSSTATASSARSTSRPSRT